MGLLHLVEQDDAVRPAAHGFGQLAAFVITHVSRRGADQTLHAELLHVLGHVDTHHGALVVEEIFGQRLRKLRLANARRAEEEEAADRTVGIGQARTAAAYGACHGGYRFVLAHDALVQLDLQVHELGHLALHHLGYGNARPCAYHLGDFLFGNLLFQNGAVALLSAYGLFCGGKLTLQLGNARITNLGSPGQIALAGCLLLFHMRGIDVRLQTLHAFDDVFLVAPFGLASIQPLFGGCHLATQVLEALCARGIAFLHKRLLFDLHLRIPALCLVDFLRHGVDLYTKTAGGFVHEVDRLVGQETIGDVAVGKLCSGHNSRVGDANAVVNFVLLLQATQDGDGVLHRRLAHQHRLETTLERSIFLDVLAVLIKRGGTDGMQLATSQRRLEHVARVHGAIARGTCAHNGMQLVDEQDDLAFALLHLPQHGLQAVLEFAAIFRSGNHSAQIKRHDVAVAQAGGNVSRHNALRQAFHDSRLANARLANEHGVVLRAARQHLDGTANFIRTTDHRIELALARLLRQVLAVRVEGVKLGLALLVGDARVAAKAVVCLLDVFARHACAGENLARLALVFGQGDEQMLARGVAVAHLLGDLHRIVDDGNQVLGGKGHAHDAARDLRPVRNGAFHVRLQGGRVGADTLDNGGEVVLPRIEQRLQQVDGVHRRRFGIARNAHGTLECLLGSHCQFVQSHGRLLRWSSNGS